MSDLTLNFDFFREHGVDQMTFVGFYLIECLSWLAIIITGFAILGIVAADVDREKERWILVGLAGGLGGSLLIWALLYVEVYFFANGAWLYTLAIIPFAWLIWWKRHALRRKLDDARYAARRWLISAGYRVAGLPRAAIQYIRRPRKPAPVEGTPTHAPTAKTQSSRTGQSSSWTGFVFTNGDAGDL